MKKGNEVVSLIGRAMTSTDLRPSDLSQIMDWSSGKWNLEDRSDYNGQDFLDILVDRLVRANYDAQGVKNKWMALMLRAIQEGGPLTKQQWIEKTVKLLKKDSLSREDSEILRTWYAQAPESAWLSGGKSIMETAFESCHWSEIEPILKYGVNPEECKVKMKFANNHKQETMLLAASPSVKILESLLKNGANPLAEWSNYDGKTNVLRWMEGRSPEYFESPLERRQVIKRLREEIQKAEMSLDPTLAIEANRKNIWSAIETAKSWMDLQGAIQASAKDVPKMRGKSGENLLHAVAFKRQEFIPSLMRLKASDDKWWTEKDNVGAGYAHYLLLGKSSSNYMDKDVVEKIIKSGKNAIDESPKTVEEWWSFHEALWSFQIKKHEELVKKSAFNNGDVFRNIWIMDDMKSAELCLSKESMEVLKNEFVPILSSKEGFERATRFWKEMAMDLEISALHRVDRTDNNPTDRSVKTGINIKDILKDGAGIWSEDAANLGLIIALNSLVRSAMLKPDITLKLYEVYKKGVDIEMKNAMAWIHAGASWKRLEEIIDGNSDRSYVRQMKRVVERLEHEDWWSKMKADMQRISLSVDAAKSLGRKTVKSNKAASAL